MLRNLEGEHIVHLKLCIPSQGAVSPQAVLWYMNGVNFLGGGPLSNTPAADYQIVAPR